jgi:hypothetical protein
MSLTELEQYRGRRLVYLESIRGIAALAVVFNYVIVAFVPAIYATQRTLPILIRILLASPASLLINGAFAVRIFFILSGFVLSLSYFRKKQARVLTAAVSRRYLRLMLPALGSVIFGWALRIVGVRVHYRECTYSERNIQRRETRRNSPENFRIRGKENPYKFFQRTNVPTGGLHSDLNENTDHRNLWFYRQHVRANIPGV